jgi:hypothetical protein
MFEKHYESGDSEVQEVADLIVSYTGIACYGSTKTKPDICNSRRTHEREQ